MNPPAQFLRAQSPSSSSSFAYLPSPANLNPNFNSNFNPNFFHYHLNNQKYPSSTTNNPITPPLPPPPLPPPPPPPPPPDLPSALSALKDLIRLSETTFESISSTTAGPAPGDIFCPCPFNPHHRVPPESLFCHFLQCPSSSVRASNLDLLESLRHPNTRQSSNELIKENRSVQTLHDPKVELCFSLDEYFDFGPNFFYRDCPGVVSSIDLDSRSPSFTLPGILSVECANFASNDYSKIKGYSVEHIKLLPSELWFVRSEIEAWNDYPTTYSVSVLRAILLSRMVQEHDFPRWVIVNSPHYGIVIDVPMSDHMVLLFCLCLKAIFSEAVGLKDSVFIGSNPATMNLECPILVEVLKWFSFQLSVLYGEVNGKLFAINMLKQWILKVSLNSSVFPMVGKTPQLLPLKDVDAKHVDSFDKSLEDEGTSVLDESIHSRVIFVSQVAAAVAALHERALLEEKIKALRDARPLTCYQRMAEHAHVSRRADEERKKRSNYRSILEHDGIFWQRPHNQDANKTKTREELLAEERDYKRRRMSYRGKKLKRSTTQVMRDIIEEYMEDITRAGGIGCLVKGAEESGKFSSEPSSLDMDGLKKNVRESSEVSRAQPYSHKQLHSRNNIRIKKLHDDSPDDHMRRTRDSSRHNEHLELRRSIERDRCDREYNSKTPGRHRTKGHSHDQISNHGHQDDVELFQKKISFSQSPDSYHSRSHGETNHRRERSDRKRGNLKSEMKDRQRSHAYRDRRSDSVTLHEFEDRYDPSESRDFYEDDVSIGTSM